MNLILNILGVLLCLANILPLFDKKHWSFRIWEYGKVQLMVLKIFTLILYCVFKSGIINNYEWLLIIIISFFLLYNLIIIIPFTFIYPTFQLNKQVNANFHEISLISINVLQSNKKFDLLIQTIREYDADLILTTETNNEWEQHLNQIENHYPYSVKIAQEDTYGMHLYSKLKIDSYEINYLVSNNLPSIKAYIKTKNGKRVLFYGVHPPPPSPTEAETAKERDGEIMIIGNQISQLTESVIVAGDFNNVSWSKSSKMFRKVSKLIDPRIGRGIFPTFHAKYPLLRFPLDLVYHSKDMDVSTIKRLAYVGSDHFPIFCKFQIYENIQLNKKTSSITDNQRNKTEKIIKEAKEA